MEKAFDGVLTELLSPQRKSTSFDQEDLQQQVYKRVGALFVHYGIWLRLDQWDKAVYNLLIAIGEDFAPWLLQTNITEQTGPVPKVFGTKQVSLPVECAWEMIIAMARTNIYGFKLSQEIPHRGIKEVFKNYELEILNAINCIQDITKQAGKKLSRERIASWNEEIFEKLPPAAQTIYQALHDNFPALTFERVKEAQKRATKKDIGLAYAERRGFIADAVQRTLNKIPYESEAKAYVALYYERYSREHQLINQVTSPKTESDQEKKLKALTNAILVHQLGNKKSSISV